MMNKIEDLEFHLESQDYFGTLATIISLNRQNLGARMNKKEIIKTLESIKKQLTYLQDNYKVVRSIKGYDKQK